MTPAADDPKKAFIETWPKQCACGQSYDEGRWETLRYVGVQHVPAELGLPDLELRNCERCCSTLAIVVPNDFVR